MHACRISYAIESALHISFIRMRSRTRACVGVFIESAGRITNFKLCSRILSATTEGRALASTRIESFQRTFANRNCIYYRARRRFRFVFFFLLFPREQLIPVNGSVSYAIMQRSTTSLRVVYFCCERNNKLRENTCAVVGTLD